MITPNFAGQRGHWKVQIKQPNPTGLPNANLNGEHYGVQFANGFAYVNWQALGEDAAYIAIQQLGSDRRFHVVEIPEKDYRPYGSK